ncbi:PD-(D/E)XK nuclease family protein [Terriglobus saanensis]|uniref:PD-(D/E)XK nuclease family protein n=1 Tax=Terriglobus saanensis TaxID=870903 RepID=UPI0016518F9A|nr:PD-(D/E)XK nuclease family protein [Terriglobus saanensis]
MSPALPIVEQVMDALSRGALVLTSNQRAARTLRLHFEGTMREEGRSGWQAPQILTWDGWVADQWRKMLIEGVTDCILLNRAQERRVWMRAIEATADSGSLLSTRAMGEMASDTTRLLSQWNAHEAFTTFQTGVSGPDVALFGRWLKTFERICDEQRWVSGSLAASRLASTVRGGGFSVPVVEILLVGFDRVLPSQGVVIEAMEERGASVDHAEQPKQAESLSLATCADDREELLACASWVKDLLACEGSGTIAVVVPDLDETREEIDRVFRERIAPWSYEMGSESAPPFEFSLGDALSKTTMVRDALLLLRWLHGPIELEQVSQIVRSPFLGNEADVSERARFDAQVLRRRKRLSLELELREAAKMLIFVKGDATPHTSLQSLSTALMQAQKLAQPRLKKAMGWSDWSDLVREVLETAGWPGPRSADSREFQLRKRWDDLLDELAGMDALGERVTYEEMLSTLRSMAEETLFAPQSRGARIQIMGPMEAAGSHFQGVWFLHADDMRWPRKSSTSPLLPWTLQKEAGMPGAAPAMDFAFARSVTERLASSAAEVVFSYAVTRAAGTMRPSPAVMALGGLNAWGRAVVDTVDTAVEVMEEVEDSTPLPALTGERLRGGAQIFELQAACSFRAFAEARLFSAQPDEVDPGMSAPERGNATHEALEKFWRRTKTQAELERLSTEIDPVSGRTKRDVVLDTCIAEALEVSDSSWERAYISIQHQRLHELLSRWLEIERKRPVPFEVRYTEHEVEETMIGDLHLRLRVDRVDEIAGENGPEFVLIDYKTGRCSPSEWLGDRPDKPQLPLYAIAGELGNVGGIGFASLRPAEKDLWLRGMTRTPDVFPPLRKRSADLDFDQQIQEWQETLLELADSFAAGDAAVGPKKYPKTCEHCGQRLLCRLDPARLMELSDEEDSEDDEA